MHLPQRGNKATLQVLQVLNLVLPPLKKTVEAEEQLHWKRKPTMTRVKMYKKRKALLLQKAGE